MRPSHSSRRTLMRTSAALWAALFAATFTPLDAAAQSDQSRVIWQLDYAPELSSAQHSEVQSVIMQTLSRAKERHFIGDTILTQKIKKEGLNFPECFTEGTPCTGGGAFVLDVHNVDAFAKALFSYNKSSKQWTITLDLYRSMSSAATQIVQSGPSLSELVQRITVSLFELESGLDITSTIPDVEIYINRKLVGKTPMTMKTSVGEQSITFKKEGYVSETWKFTAEKGNVYSKLVELRPEETQLTVLTTAEDAHIIIDDAEWGLSNETHNILPGNHRIEIRSETHHTYAQDYKIYPGTPQTIQAALLPNSRSPYEIRHEGISKYRLSTSIGYHFASQDLRFGRAKFNNKHPNISETAYFSGISLGLNYENEYWGIQILRLDVGGSSMKGEFEIDDELYKSSSAMFFGLYPAQIKAHYTFWVMQAEASFGLGYALTKLTAKKSVSKKNITQNAFSIDFSLGLKYFFSEESFAMFAYDMQYDVADKSKARHGFTLGIGLQIPVWMRTDDAPDPELEPESANDNASNSPENSNNASNNGYILPSDSDDDFLPIDEENDL